MHLTITPSSHRILTYPVLDNRKYWKQYCLDKWAQHNLPQVESADELKFFWQQTNLASGQFIVEQVS